MVTDPLWIQAVGVRGMFGLQCIACLERRIGRQLIPTDFTDCPVNRDPFRPRSQRLEDRLGKMP
jgi:hypothetical protein